MKKVIAKLFSDSNEVSFGRVAAALSLLFTCGWVTYLVVRNSALPDLTSTAVFIAAPYGLSKAGETIQKFTNKLQGKPEEAPPATIGAGG